MNTIFSDYNKYPKHAWFSKNAKRQKSLQITFDDTRNIVSNMYEHVNGELVECTAVSNNYEFHNEYNWDDKIYLGLVRKWVSVNYN